MDQLTGLKYTPTSEIGWVGTKERTHQLGMQFMRFCWATKLSPYLTRLETTGIFLNNSHEPGLLGRVIGGLVHLRELHLHVECDVLEVYFDWKQLVGHYPNLLKIEELDKADEEEVQRDVPREPFRYLRTLNLESDHAYDADDICPFLERCAGLTSLVVPSARTTEDRIRIATCIATHCPKLKRVFRWSRSKEAIATESTFSAIVDTVPINSLATFEIVQHDNDDLKLCLAIPLHYESLTWIKFSNCRRLDSSVILGILRECSSMQHFEVNGDDRFLWDVSITLEDAVEKPWASRELQVLELAVDLGENMTNSTLANGQKHFQSGSSGNGWQPWRNFMSRSERYIN
ncbi:hypothetical protein BGX29_003153 [Mortierella sp. GBA35]|nr:hypothetical protein BGX29_003153 [Mortierella sp. GBA35]